MIKIPPFFCFVVGGGGGGGGHNIQGVQCRQVFVVIFFFCTVVALCDLEHDMETIFHHC